MSKVKGKFNKKAIKEEIKQLEEKLKKVEASIMSMWESYNSESVYSDMIEEKRKIESEINILKNKLNPSDTYKELLAITQEHKNGKMN